MDQGCMACLSSPHLGLLPCPGVGVLRLSGGALAVSLIRYVLAAYGSGLRERAMNQLEAPPVDALARRVAGLSRSARPSPLDVTAGMLSVHNL